MAIEWIRPTSYRRWMVQGYGRLRGTNDWKGRVFMVSHWRKGLAVLLLTLCLTPAAMATTRQDEETLEASLCRVLHGAGSLRHLDVGGYALKLLEETATFYTRRGFVPAWLTDGGLSAQAEEVLATLHGAFREGLNPQEYHGSTLELFAGQVHAFADRKLVADADLLVRFDILLSDGFLRYARDLSRGRVAASRIYGPEWSAATPAVHLPQLLQQALEDGAAAAALDALLPQDDDYRQLREGLAKYRRIAVAGGWSQLSAGPVVRPGDRDRRLPWLRRHLLKLGDLDSVKEGSEDLLDSELVQALRRYQQRHGLHADGALGAETLATLNRSVEERIKQIEINLERRRWMPQESEQRSIRINVPDFRLDVLEDKEAVLSMSVIVGTRERRTPVFSALMRYLDFAPYWYVPRTILREDKLHLVRTDLDYLTSHHYEIVTWRDGRAEIVAPDTVNWDSYGVEGFPGALRQKPGPWNALGRVKFMFPNRHQVYLHDTPQRYLFQHRQRAYSSGCIRVEKPAELALYLLRNQQGWDAERVAESMAAATEHRVLLDRPIPVHIRYQTAWADAQGRLQFRRDIYGWDELLYAALRRHSRDRSRVVAVSPPSSFSVGHPCNTIGASTSGAFPNLSGDPSRL